MFLMKKIQPRISYSREKLKKYLNSRNILIGLILFFLLMAVGKYVMAIVLTVLFIPLGLFTIRFSKFVPHVNIETITICSIFMGYIYGTKIGVLFALVIGNYCFFKNSQISLSFLAVPALAAAITVVAGVFKANGFDLASTLVFSILIRNIVGLPIYMFFLVPNPPENIIHHTTHTFLNIFIYTPVLTVLYELVKLFK
jgi:hypothetical protein